MGNHIELRHLRYFLAVAEDLHFRRAAEKLYISQPGLSRQIKQMEADLDIELFKRNNRKVNLTDAGIYLKKETELILRHLDEVLEHAKLLSEGLEGNIKLGYVGSAMQNVIPNLLIEFRKSNPTILFSLKEMDNLSQIKALLNNKIDVGFVRMNKVPNNLKLKPILKDTFSLVLPKDHPLDAGNFKSIKQLKNDSFILFDPNYSPAYYERVRSIFDKAGFEPIISHDTVHASTIFRLVQNHFGVSIIPTSLTEGYDMNVKFIELKNIPQRAILSVAWNVNNRNPILGKILKYL